MSTEGYLSVSGTPIDRDAQVARTWQVTASLLVDLDADGTVIGVESLSGPVDFAALLSVLRHARLDVPYLAAWGEPS